jgi:hypothetical protein
MDETRNRPPRLFARRGVLIAIAMAVAVLAVLITRLPRGFSDDLSRIGRGSYVAVLVHDKNSVWSHNLMALLNQVRSDYAGRVEMLVADVETESGRAFVQAQRLGGGSLVFFGPDGMRRGVLVGAVDESGLRRALDDASSLPH